MAIVPVTFIIHARFRGFEIRRRGVVPSKLLEHALAVADRVPSNKVNCRFELWITSPRDGW